MGRHRRDCRIAPIPMPGTHARPPPHPCGLKQINTARCQLSWRRMAQQVSLGMSDESAHWRLCSGLAQPSRALLAWRGPIPPKLRRPRRRTPARRRAAPQTPPNPRYPPHPAGRPQTARARTLRNRPPPPPRSRRPRSPRSISVTVSCSPVRVGHTAARRPRRLRRASTKSTVDLGGGVALSSSGGALTSSESTTSKLPEAAVTPMAPTDTAAQSSAPAAVPSGSRDTKSRHDGSRHQTAPVHPPPSAVVNRAPPAPKVTVSVGPGTGHQTAGSPGSPAVAVRPTPVVVNSLPSSLPAVQKAAAPPAERASESVVQRALSALLGPLLAPGTNSPTDTPLMWALLAAARRQLGTDTGSISLSDGNLLRANTDTSEPGGDAIVPPDVFPLTFIGADTEKCTVSGYFNVVDWDTFTGRNGTEPG